MDAARTAAGDEGAGLASRWLPGHIPEVVAEWFNERRAELELLYAIEVSGRHRRNGARLDGATLNIDDPRLAWLQEHWECYGWGPQGQQHLLCPFKAGHSMESGESECCYFPAGTRGYFNGHWVCQHASCQERSDEEFDAEVGYEAPGLEFPDLTEEAERTGDASGKQSGDAGDAQPPARPKGFIGVTKDGHIPATIANVMLALETPTWFGADMALDDFKDEVVFKAKGTKAWRALQDDDYTLMRRRLEQRGFKAVGPEVIRSAVRAVARTYHFDSAQEWLKSLVWDGRERVNGYLADYFGSEPGPIATAISRYWWSAHAARILYPGCRCDMVPILVSPEGKWKSSGLQAMVPDLDWFVEIDLEHMDDDLSRKMRGAALGELAELRGLSGRKAEANKAWVTKRFEEWTPKYIEHKHRVLRRIVFAGTTNEDEMLDETTGERRWLPVKVKEAKRDLIHRDRDQLWAEAREIVLERMREPGRSEEDACAWEDAHAIGAQAREEFTREDGWSAAVARFIDRSVLEGQANGQHDIYCTIEEALVGAVGLLPGKYEKRHEMRMGKILRAHGCTKERTVLSGKQVRVYRLTIADLA